MHEVIINGEILIFNISVMHITYNYSDNTTHTNWDVFPSIIPLYKTANPCITFQSSSITCNCTKYSTSRTILF